MFKSIRYFLAVIIAVTGFSLGLATFANAASECKSLESKSACQRRDDCVYVGSYKTSKGKKISAYCRSRGKVAKKTTAAGKKAKTPKKTRAEVKKKVKAKAKTKSEAGAKTAKKTRAGKKIKKTVRKKAEKKPEAKPESKTKAKKKVKKKVKIKAGKKVEKKAATK